MRHRSVLLGSLIPLLIPQAGVRVFERPAKPAPQPAPVVRCAGPTRTDTRTPPPLPEWFKKALPGVTLPADNYPPGRFVDPGACPYECCQYGDWVAETDIVLYDDWNAKASRKVTVVRAGEKVTAVTGVVITTRPGAALLHEPLVINGVTLCPGDVVFLLTYQGEGDYKLWFRGRLIGDAEMEGAGLKVSLVHPKDKWWVQIRTSPGVTGWTDQPQHFDGRDACG